MASVIRTRRLVKAAYPLLRPWQQRSVIPAVAPASTQTEKNVVYSHLPPCPIPSQDLHHLMYQRLEKWRHLDASECAVTGRKYTFGDILDKGLKWGSIVNSILPPPSPSSAPQPRTVAIFSQNNPEFPMFMLGTMAVGATVATINCNYTPVEVARQLENGDVGMVVTDPSLEGVLKQALARIGKKLPVFVNGASQEGYVDVRKLLDDPNVPFCELVEVPTESTAALLFSSGTTGPPKGVQLSHRSFTSNVTAFTHPKIFPCQPPGDGEQQHTVTGVLPFYHIYGFFVITIMSMHQGAKVVSFPAFDPVTFIKVIKEQKVRILHLVPPILNFLTSNDLVTPDYLESLEGAMCAAAPVPTTAARMLQDKVPRPIIFQEGFGLTEALGTHMTPLDDTRLGFCGKVVPNVEAKVVNEEGEALPEGQRGELCIRGPSLMTGYYNNPEATANAIDSDGWLHTGDVAVHTDGFFSIVDRLKELIKVKTFQVSPSELEDVLLQHPGVQDVAVVGVPDARAGELPRAYIIKSSHSCSEDDIHNFLKDKVADFKKLKGGVRFVDALPKNPTGKVLRRELKEIAAKE